MTEYSWNHRHVRFFIEGGHVHFALSPHSARELASLLQKRAADVMSGDVSRGAA